MAKYFDVNRAIQDGGDPIQIQAFMRANNLSPLPAQTTQTEVQPTLPQEEQQVRQGVLESIGQGAIGLGKELTLPFRQTAEGLSDYPRLLSHLASKVSGGKVGTEVTGMEKPVFLSEEENKRLQQATAENAPLQAAKMAAGMGSFAVPFGKAGFIGSKFIIPGAAVGASQEFSKPDSTTEGVIGAGIVGAGSAGALQGAGKAIISTGRGLTKKLPEKIMEGVFKEPIKATKAGISGGTTLGKEALERGQVGTTEKLYKTAITQIDNTENTLQTVLMDSNAKISMNNIKRAVQPLIDKYRQAGNETAATALEGRLASIEAQNGSSIPAAAANEIKRTLYDEAQKAYGTEASANMEGIKAIARGLKEGLEKVPGVQQLNKDLSFYGRARNAMLDKMTKDQRNNVLGLTDAVIGAGGLATGVGLPAIAAIGAKKLLGSTLGKTGIAQGLNKAGKILTLPAIPQGVTDVAGQITSRLPGILTSPQPYQDNDKQQSENEQLEPPMANIPQTPIESQNPYPIENYVADIQRDPKNASQYKAIYDAYQKQYPSATGKKGVSSGQVTELSDIEGSIKLASDLDAYLDKSKDLIGPIQGRIGSVNPYSTDAQIFNSNMMTAAQIIGKAMEGGVLRQEDMIKYRKILPQIEDTYDVAKGKMAAVRQMLNDRLSIKQNLYGKYDTSTTLPDIGSQPLSY